MPRILLEVPQDEFSVEDIRTNPQAVCKQLHALAKSKIADNLTDPEAYVLDYDGIGEDHILGAIEPKQMLADVLQWNFNIRLNLLRAIGGFIEYVGQIGAAKDNSAMLWLDSSATYRLKKAALSADNCFFDFAEEFVYLPNEKGCTYLSAAINDQQLEAIIAAPEHYAILPICMK